MSNRANRPSQLRTNRLNALYVVLQAVKDLHFIGGGSTQAWDPFSKWRRDVADALRGECLTWDAARLGRLRELCNQQAYALREVQARGGTLAEARAQLRPVHEFVAAVNARAGTTSFCPPPHSPLAGPSTYPTTSYAAPPSPYASGAYQAPPYAATPPSYALAPYKAPQYAASPEYASPAHQSPLRAPAAPSTAYPSHALAATPAPSYNFWERDPNRDEWGTEILSSNPFEYEEPRGESSSSHHQHRQHSLAKGPAVMDRAARRYGFRSARDWRAAQGW
ncbi:hypothetical protein JCM6882_004060 [Rhodosporidiobolus microsporus]